MCVCVSQMTSLQHPALVCSLILPCDLVHISSSCLIWIWSGVTPQSTGPYQNKTPQTCAEFVLDLKKRKTEDIFWLPSDLMSKIKVKEIGDLSSHCLAVYHMLDHFTYKADLHHMGYKNLQVIQTFWTDHCQQNCTFSFYGHAGWCLTYKEHDVIVRSPTSQSKSFFKKCFHHFNSHTF